MFLPHPTANIFLYVSMFSCPARDGCFYPIPQLIYFCMYQCLVVLRGTDVSIPSHAVLASSRLMCPPKLLAGF